MEANTDVKKERTPRVVKTFDQMDERERAIYTKNQEIRRIREDAKAEKRAILEAKKAQAGNRDIEIAKIQTAVDAVQQLIYEWNKAGKTKKLDMKLLPQIETILLKN